MIKKRSGLFTVVLIILLGLSLVAKSGSDNKNNHQNGQLTQVKK